MGINMEPADEVLEKFEWLEKVLGILAPLTIFVSFYIMLKYEGNPIGLKLFVISMVLNVFWILHKAIILFLVLGYRIMMKWLKGKLYPRPDFTKESIEMVDCVLKDKDGNQAEAPEAIFNNYPPREAVTRGWFTDEKAYFMVAALEFFRRFPNHERAKKFLSKYHYSEKEILDMVTGKVRIEVE